MQLYHITLPTHNSRVSERMIVYKVKRGMPLLLSADDEVEITRYIARVVQRDKLRILAYNICRDHVHFALLCHSNSRDRIVGLLKREAALKYKKQHGIENEFHFLAQKYGHKEIRSDQQLANTIDYIRYNRLKQHLPPNPGLRPIVSTMVTSPEQKVVNC